jgi:hemerythrin-like domain-containing protein
MLVKLGQRDTTEDVVDLLRECHDRIRRFLGFAHRLASAEGLAAGEIRDVAGQIYRYFTVSLPLHVADEDVDLAPRLRGTSAEVDAALATMTREHVEHERATAAVVALCAELARDPAQHASRAPELAAATATLAALFDPHLELEERVIFPALAALPAADRDALRLAMRARRGG